MPEPHLRAADADRAAVATVLGEHMAAGRLTLDEYDERLTRAYAARTYGELDELTADLPATRRPDRRPHGAPAPHEPTRATSGAWTGWDDRRRLAQSWLSTSLIVLTHLGDDLDRQLGAPLLLAGLGHRALGRRPAGADDHRRADDERRRERGELGASSGPRQRTPPGTRAGR